MTIKLKTPEVLSSLNSKATQFHYKIKEAIERGIKRAEYISKREYLSGPRPEILSPVTGNLRSSVRGTVIEQAKIITGELSAGPLPYAAIHELGGMAGKGRRARIKARPYLKPSIDKVKLGLEGEIDKIFKELQK